jgi:hypothetical protein
VGLVQDREEQAPLWVAGMGEDRLATRLLRRKHIATGRYHWIATTVLSERRTA